jgi:hypothetical protein
MSKEKGCAGPSCNIGAACDVTDCPVTDRTENANVARMKSRRLVSIAIGKVERIGMPR